jgi:hypothetical protein
MLVCCRRTWFWCYLDQLAKCKFQWICDRHDEAITRAFPVEPDECAHERSITLMFGERECLDCGRVTIPE